MIKSILIAILVLIVVAFLFLAYFAVCFVGVCQALGARGQAIEWSRNYWNTMSQKRWDELSEEEKDDLVKAYATILDDCGAYNQTDYELREYLRKHLPIITINLSNTLSVNDNINE